MSDWLEWKGGTCPVAGGAVVDVTFRNVGEAVKRQRADFWVWYHDGADDDIVAYRVVDAQPGPVAMDEPASALAVQEGGDHYKKLAIQPIEYIHANGIPFAEGSVIKYVSRWRDKGGIKDLEKARHFLDLLIELETKGGAR